MGTMRPMLACEATQDRLEKLLRETYLFASPKLDGIRAIVWDGKLVSRSLKPIKNHHIRTALSTHRLEGVDGELIVGVPNDISTTFNTTTSGVMSEAGVPDFKWYIFDAIFGHHVAYTERLDYLDAVKDVHPSIVILPQRRICSIEELTAFEQQALSDGFEGLIVRDPRSPYKFGRSTLTQGWMLKVKRFKDSEAVVIGFEPLYRNNNEAVLDNLGLQKRSSHLANMEADEMLGALIVRDIHTGWQFNIGSGFDVSTREDIWKRREMFLGKLVKYKYQEYGTRDKPRTPVFIGFRDPIDINTDRLWDRAELAGLNFSAGGGNGV